MAVDQKNDDDKKVMKRSKWKVKFTRLDIDSVFSADIKQIKIDERNSEIDATLIDKKIYIYNGKKYYGIYIDRFKLGHKFGEFAYSRTKGVHKKKKKRHGS